MGYTIEIFTEEGWITRDFCLRQAVAYLQYRNALGQSFARIPEGSSLTLDAMQTELGNLPPDADCNGCNEKKAATKKK